MIQFDKLEIERARFGNAGGITGRIQFSTTNSWTSLKLSDDAARRILALIADEMVAETHELAKVLRADIIPLLPEAR